MHTNLRTDDDLCPNRPFIFCCLWLTGLNRFNNFNLAYLWVVIREVIEMWEKNITNVTNWHYWLRFFYFSSLDSFSAWILPKVPWLYYFLADIKGVIYFVYLFQSAPMKNLVLFIQLFPWSRDANCPYWYSNNRCKLVTCIQQLYLLQYQSQLIWLYYRK